MLMVDHELEPGGQPETAPPRRASPGRALRAAPREAGRSEGRGKGAPRAGLAKAAGRLDAGPAPRELRATAEGERGGTTARSPAHPVAADGGHPLRVVPRI